jgi:hypothetical protein
MMATARRSLGALALLAVAALACGNARGDGGTLLLCEVAGHYRVSAFTSPSPPRAGQLDVSVLVQDAASGAILPHAEVVVRVASTDRSHADESRAAKSYAATQEAATNKLLHAAICQLPTAGPWRVEINVRDPASENSTSDTVVAFDLVAGEPLPRWWDMEPWIGWPLVVIVLFGVHQALAARQRVRRSARNLHAIAALDFCRHR